MLLLRTVENIHLADFWDGVLMQIKWCLARCLPCIANLSGSEDEDGRAGRRTGGEVLLLIYLGIYSVICSCAVKQLSHALPGI